MNLLYLILLLVFFLKGFGFVVLNHGFLDYVFMCICFPLTYNATTNFKERYSKIVLLYVSFVFLSCIYSCIYNEQNFYMVFFRSFYYFSLLFYFVLLKFKFKSKDIEKAIEYLSLLFCICYILQWLLYPVVIFGGADSSDISESHFRMRMPGSICCYTLLLLGINKYLVTNKYRYLLYIFMGGLPILIQGFRSLITLSIVASFVMIPFILKKVSKTIIMSIIFGGAIVFAINYSETVQYKIEEMTKRNESEQLFTNDSYIRWLALDYFWNHQYKNTAEKIIGGGEPIDNTTAYYRSIKHARDFYGYYSVDLGIIGLSMTIGIPATILLVLIYFLLMLRFKDVNYQYVRFTLFIVLAGSVMTSMELFRPGNILLLSLFVYLEYIRSVEKRMIVTN